MIKSPRYTRQQRIVVKNLIGEIDGNANYHTTTVNNVSVDVSYGVKQTQKGNQAEGTTCIIIDLNDLVAFCGMKKRKYVDAIEFAELEAIDDYFTISPGNDLIHYKWHDYTVVSTNVIESLNASCFLRVIANE